MDFRNIFKPKPDKFLILLVNQAELTVKGLEQLVLYSRKRDSDVAKKIARTEKDEDEVRRILIEELMRTFITPLDREDIFSLSREIDDILDYANTTVDEMEILDVTPTPFMLQMATLLRDAGIEIKLGVERLQDKHLSVASTHAQRAKSLENQVETLYRESLASLFRETKSVKHVINMLKVREIYRHMSNAADRGDSAANIIQDIIMKST